MEIHQLRYVVAVAHTGNFSRAAESCHVAQPSLSQQIQKLEDELGERLFDRLRRRAKLTAAGERLLQRAVRILDEIDAATRESAATRGLLQGRLTLGVLPTIAPYLLPGAIASFRAEYPEIAIVVHEDTTIPLTQLVTACEVDFAIASQPVHDERFEVRELFREELLLALTPDHPLTQRGPIQASDLDTERFILMKEGHCLGDQVLQFCQKRDFHPSIHCRSAQIGTIQALVQAGVGISLVPKMAAQQPGGQALVYHSLEEPKPQRTIVAFWLKQRPPGPAALEFIHRLQPAGGS